MQNIRSFPQLLIRNNLPPTPRKEQKHDKRKLGLSATIPVETIKKIRFLMEHRGWTVKATAEKFKVSEGYVQQLKQYVSRASIEVNENTFPAGIDWI